MIVMSTTAAAAAAAAAATSAGGSGPALSVAVIGAGPSGLSAARHLLRCGIEPTVFERASCVGGLWRRRAAEQRGGGDGTQSTAGTWDGLETNLSRFTCAFPDFPWASEEVGSRLEACPEGGGPGREEREQAEDAGQTQQKLYVDKTKKEQQRRQVVGTFPTREQMSCYLEGYADRYLRGVGVGSAAGGGPPEDRFRFGCTVTNVVRHSGGGGDDGGGSGGGGGGGRRPRYSVSWTEESALGRTDEEEEEEEEDAASSGSREGKTTRVESFDGVVVATGFFSRPRFPAGLTGFHRRGDDASAAASVTEQGEGSDDAPPTAPPRGGSVNVIHSSQYANPAPHSDRTVAVIGSSFSALEIASDVSRTAARVVAVLPRIPWVLPRYVPMAPISSKSDEPATAAFAPLDLVLYRRADDEAAPKRPERTRTAADDDDGEEEFKTLCQSKHDHLASLLGTTKQSIIGMPDATTPPFVAISDPFLDLVADGTVEVVAGRRLAGLSEDGRGLVLSEADGNGNGDGDDGAGTTTVLGGIDDVICCTGLSPSLGTVLDRESILDVLRYDEDDMFMPLTLCRDAYHPRLPDLGFVGMYRGPYFGVIDLQARLVAERISGRRRGRVGGGDAGLEETGQEETEEEGEEEETRLLEESESIRRSEPRPQFPHGDYVALMDTLATDLGLVPPDELGGGGTVVVPGLYQPDAALARLAADEVGGELRECEDDGKYVPRAVLGGLGGRWAFSRTITHDPGTSAARSETVDGTVLYSTRRGPDPRDDALLYREDGVWRSPMGEFEVHREYEYSLNDETGALQIHFVESGKKAGLFLSFPPFRRVDGGFWEASSDHLCVRDLYKGTFRVAFDGLAARDVRIQYRVNGPKKNYVSVTDLRRL